jgi:hypothetical protein
MAARVTKDKYEAMKGFFLWYCRDRLSPMHDKIDLSPEERPDAVMRSLEQKSLAIAREGLRMAIGDIIEETQYLGRDEVDRVDAALAAEGLPTLSQVRIEFWAKISGIIKRGKVRSETEYYALRNVVESMLEPDQSKAWSFLEEFESRKAN